MTGLGRDLRFALRMLRKSPGFTAVAVGTLALGIGANSSIFTFVDAIYLRPLPVDRPERLVELTRAVSFPTYRDLAEGIPAIDGLVARGSTSVNLDDGRTTLRVPAELVTGNYFHVLGVPAALGRTFGPGEDRSPGSDPVVVLSHGLWSETFGADPDVVGRSVRINGHPFTVLGVAPRGFTGTELGAAPSLWAPMMAYREVVPGWEFLDARREIWLRSFGRLAPGITLPQARVQLRSVGERIAADHPDAPPGEIGLARLGRTGSELRESMFPVVAVLSATVGIILLIACANLANLLLARGTSRRRELGVRIALGASRARLVRQLLLESLLLSLLGGVAGLLVSSWGNDLIATSLLQGTSGVDLALDGRVLAFTGGAVVLTAMLFGLVPALLASGRRLAPALREELPGATGGRTRARGALVVTQVALSLMLLIACGLFVRNLASQQAVDPGFRAADVLTFRISASGYDAGGGRQLHDRLRERLEGLPGVTGVTQAQLVQLGGGNIARPIARVDEDPSAKERMAAYNVVGEGYFRVLGLPLAAGREFDARDRQGPPTVIVNETLARQMWPGEPAVGKQVYLPLEERGPAYEVIGVARDSKYHELTEGAKGYFYLPFSREYRGRMTVLVRTSADPLSLAGPARDELRALDPLLPAYAMRTVEGLIGRQLARPRSIALAAALFGGLALALAAIGLYGLISYSVSQRTREIGVRMALGARARDILRLVIGRGMGLTAVGILLGLAGGMAGASVVGRALPGLLFGVPPMDPASFGLGLIVLSAVAFAATWLPAMRAARVDPTRALRTE